MTFYEINSDQLRAKISTMGAELNLLQRQGQSHNWIWSGHEPWQRSAPHLFPIVGKLMEDCYRFKGQTYQLTQHGFARDLEFLVVAQSESQLQLRLNSSALTKKYYPFDFSFDVLFQLKSATLNVEYQVTNLGTDEMYFNVGWHPAFVLPAQDALPLTIESDKEFSVYHKLKSGLLDSTKTFDCGDRVLTITRSSFDDDAWVFLVNTADTLILSDAQQNKLTLKTDNAPFLGLWSKDPTKFLCIEPWWGVADLIGCSGDLNTKHGIQVLRGGEKWTARMSVEI